MKNISRLFLFGALTLMLMTAACAGQQGLPTATAQATSTAIPALTSTSTASTPSETATPNTTLTPGIPVTSLTVSLVCQFCIDTFAHALVVIPAGTTFTVLTPTASVSTTTDTNPSCNTVETLNDQQIVLCRAPSNTLITLSVCAGNNCQPFTVRLQTCPPLPVATFTRTPTSTPTPSKTPTVTPPVGSPTSPSPTSTSTVSSPTSTPTAGSPTPTLTPSPTATP
jgi:hypothetical protein